MKHTSESIQADIEAFFANHGHITEVQRGAMARPETAYEPSWQDESRRHSFTISRQRDLYQQPVNDDGEAVL